MLNNLAKSFYECYQKGLEKKEMTINIILNLYLIEPINSFIEENKDNEILDDKIIKNSFKNSGEEINYVFNSFRNEEFEKYYNN